MPISIASLPDIPALVKLINSAYRGEESKKGWTTEAYVLDGELRTDPPTLEKLMQTPGSVILKYSNPENIIEGCVFLQKRGNRLYLGMLSVSPLLQAKGIGKELMNASESYASEQNCTAVFMRVISLRDELIAWYQRRGYSLTGETEPMPDDNRFGVPNRPLEFVIMEKNTPSPASRRGGRFLF